MIHVIESNRRQEQYLKLAVNEILGAPERTAKNRLRMKLRNHEILKPIQGWSGYHYRREDVPHSLAKLVFGEVLGAVNKHVDPFREHQNAFWLPMVFRELQVKLDHLCLRIEVDDWGFTPLVDIEFSFSRSRSEEQLEALITTNMEVELNKVLSRCFESNRPKNAASPSLAIDCASWGTSIELELSFESHQRPVRTEIDLKNINVRTGDIGLVRSVVERLHADSILVSRLSFLGYDKWLDQVRSRIEGREADG